MFLHVYFLALFPSYPWFRRFCSTVISGGGGSPRT